MKIAFILPMPTAKIVGGYKVVYEYANYLAMNDYKVTIFYNSNKGINSKRLPKILVYLMRNLICKREPRWFNLSRKIKKVNLYSLKSSAFDEYDVIISTAAETAVFANTILNKRKVYLIQDFESNWELSPGELIKTYNYNMNLVVISKWLEKKVSGLSKQKVTYIPNGINRDIFHNMHKKRKIHSICMLYHLDERKDFKTGFNVIKKLKLEYPDLVVNIFGTSKRPKEWPNWIKYIRFAKPYQVARLMNESTVFLCTSKKEGFGLTGLESIFCGCTLVTTDCGGVREYASEKNSLISNVGDTASLVKNVSLAFDSDSLRNKLLKENYYVIKKFDLDKSKEAFKKVVVGE